MFFCIYKPRGISSHTAVHRFKKKLGYSRVGHAGTLDQEAEGLLIIAVEGATPLLGELLGQDKTYEYTIDLSIHSPSHDLSTPQRLHEGAIYPTQDQLEEVIQEHFFGEIEQVPPIYSAIWVDGKRSYDLVLRGESVELKKRPVTVYTHEILSYIPPLVHGRVTVSSGTYIRSIARDLASLLDTGGVITRLMRTQIGSLSIEESIQVDDVTRSNTLPIDRLIPIDRTRVVSDEEIVYIKNGDFRFYLISEPGRELLMDQAGQAISLIEINQDHNIEILAQLYPRPGKRGMIGIL